MFGKRDPFFVGSVHVVEAQVCALRGPVILRCPPVLLGGNHFFNMILCTQIMVDRAV